MRGNSEFRLEIDGAVYHSLDEVPPELRADIEAMLADRDGDGIPDIVQRGGGATHVTRTETFVIDGQTYESIDEVPADHREMLHRLSGQSDDRNDRTTMAAAAPTPTAPQSGTPIVQKASMSKKSKLLLASFVVDAIVIAVVLYVILR